MPFQKRPINELKYFERQYKMIFEKGKFQSHPNQPPAHPLQLSLLLSKKVDYQNEKWGTTEVWNLPLIIMAKGGYLRGRKGVLIISVEGLFLDSLKVLKRTARKKK